MRKYSMKRKMAAVLCAVMLGGSLPLSVLAENLQVEQDGDMVVFTVSADGYLYNMVRIMVGTLVNVGKGIWQPEQVAEIIAAQNRDAAGPTAPPQGLFLTDVYYDFK